MNYDDYKEFACASLLERVDAIRLKISALFVQAGNNVLIDHASSIPSTLAPIESALKATQEVIGDVICELSEESLRLKRREEILRREREGGERT
jgi:hypothetical protein